MNKRISIFNLLKNEGKLTKVLIYVAQESENDPYEHTKSLSYQQPVAIEALVRNINQEALIWKYYGLIPSESKEIIVEKKHTNLFRIADKIKVGDNYYKTYKEESKGFGILERNDYSIIILSLKVN